VREPGVADALGLYAQGWFPMDEPGVPGPLPWYAVEERAVLELDEASRDALRRRVRRDVRDCAGLELTVDGSFEHVLALCAEPPGDDGQWLSPRLQALYRDMHAAGFAHSFELRDPGGGDLAAGIVGVVLGRAALLESMRKVRPKAGNALLVRTLDFLVERGIELCDIQMPTPHTLRLGAHLIPRGEYERRLAAALGQG
jgi:leucyl/phenylalanyl-tRNA--protein transferase